MTKISFPKLGINLNINPVAFSILGKSIYWYAVLILTGFLIAVFFCAKSAQKRNINPDYIFDIALYGLLFGLIGARVYYVLFDFKTYAENPASIFKVWEGGLAIYGGLIGAVLTAFVYCRKKKLNVLEIFDICAPGLLIGQIIGRFGNFVNAEVYGRSTDLFLGMSINGGSPVHPLFLYEALWNLAGLVIMLCLRDKKTKHGQVILGYFFWYSSGRLFLEGMRDSEYILYLVDGILGISQVVSAVLVILSATLFVLLTKHKEKTK